MGSTVKSLAVLSLVATTLFVSSIQVEAKPAFAKKEKKTCNYCHSVEKGGGPRGFRGMYYGAHKLSLKGFVEKTEAKKAGVKPDSMGPASKPTKPYTGK